MAEKDHLSIDKDQAKKLAELINSGGWDGPDGQVTAELLSFGMRLKFGPKDRIVSAAWISYNSECPCMIFSDPHPELIVLTAAKGDSHFPDCNPGLTSIDLVHKSNRKSNIRRRRRSIKGRLERRGVECAWDKDGQLTLTFEDGKSYEVR
jgi:hypothetical protein